MKSETGKSDLHGFNNLAVFRYYPIKAVFGLTGQYTISQFSKINPNMTKSEQGYCIFNK